MNIKAAEAKVSRVDSEAIKATIQIEVSPTKDSETPTVVRTSQEDAAKFHVGDPIDVHLSGNVRAIRNVSKSDQRQRMVEIEIEGPEITSLAMNPADFEMKRMVD